ncbi:MAG: phospholipase D-like domain-containing protein, partial [Myxococcales bacterium]
ACFRERWVLDGGDDFGSVEPVPDAAPPRGIPLDAAALYKNQPDSTPNHVRHLFLGCIGEARRSIFIENPYVYHPRIIAELCAAARRKVRVDLVVPALKWNDNEFSQDAMQHEYPELLESGVSIFEYQNHFTHLKLATFDERLSIVGSANLNFRSLENDNDFELVARVESAEFARGINAEVRDVDVPFSLPIERGGVGFRARVRDPRTLFLVWRRLL